MIFDLYKAHQIMKSNKYGIAGKLLRLHRLGLPYKKVYRFFDIYLKMYPDTPFKEYKPKNEDKE